MSTYDVNLFSHSLAGEQSLRDSVAEDPNVALADFDLDDEERRMLFSGEVGLPYERGVDGFLLDNLERLTHLVPDLETYSDRMRGATRE